MIEFSAKVAKIWKSRRARIILSAILTGVFFGISALGLPAEDVLSGTRTLVWRETAPQDIVVVEIDESTLSQIGTDDTPRSADAKLVKTLFDQGVSRVFFDRTYYFQEDAAGDQALAKALKQYPDRVFMGALKGETDSATEVSMLPACIFRGDVGVVSLMAYYHPFKLSVSFPFKSSTPDGEVPSMAAKLADLDNPPEGMFKPDYAMDASTIPRFSYIDVLNQKVPDAKLQGRDVVIAPSAITFNDYHAMPFQGIMPGAYFQVIAAHTLRRGVPRDLGWIPAFVLVSILVISGVGRGRSIDRYRNVK